MNKEFRYINSIIYYSILADKESAFVWHRCVDTPARMGAAECREQMTESGHTCPFCGQFVLEWTEMEEYGLAPDAGRADEGCFLKFADTDCIAVNSEGHRVRVDISGTGFTFHETRAARGIAYRVRYTINVKTGHTYMFDAPMDVDIHDMRRKEIYDISYISTGQELPDAVLDYAYEAVYGIMKQVHGTDVPGFETYGVELTLNNLIRYVRNPYICPVLYGSLVTLGRRDGPHAMGPVPKELVVKNTCRNPVMQMVRQSRIPRVKSLKRIIYAENDESLPLLASISRSFRNVDVIRSLYRAYSGCITNFGFLDSYVDFSCKIVKKIVKHKGEAVAANKYISLIRRAKAENAREILQRMAIDYAKLECFGSGFEFDFGGSYDIEELHIALALAVAKRGAKNREIPYSGKELSLARKDGELSILPAKDTYELAEVGAVMSICVGSYAEPATEKDCSIFVLREREGHKPVGCIELRGGSVCQAKGAFNKPLAGKRAEFVKKWAADNSLQIETRDI